MDDRRALLGWGMRKGNKFVLAVAAVLGTVLAAYLYLQNSGNAPQPLQGDFFRLTTKVEYKGVPVEISYPVGCKIIGSKQADGDVSVDGTSIVPFVFGKKMHDGGALVVWTPDFCGPRWSSDSSHEQTRIPPDYNPTVIHFEDAERPWFGIAYIERVAYDSPHSVMKFIGSRVDRITGQEWLDWRKANPDANWVTWDKMGLKPNWFATVHWEPGMKKMPTICNVASFLKLTEEARAIVREFWPGDRPFLWHSDEARKALSRYIGRRQKLTLNEPPSPLFDGLPAWDYDRTPISPKKPKYPARTDFGMNDLGGDGAVDQAKIIDGTTIPHGNWIGPTPDVLTRMDVLWEEEYRGFGFCNASDQVNNEDRKRSFGDLGGIYKVNGHQMNGDYVHPRYSLGGGFIKDEYSVGFHEYILFGMGGRL